MMRQIVSEIPKATKGCLMQNVQFAKSAID